MSTKKTRKEKIRSARSNQIRTQKLEQLRLHAKDLQEKITKQRLENFKQFNIRNLKIFANVCNFVAPFVLSTGIIVGTFGVFGGGLPFHLDEITKYKVYNLEFETNGPITVEDGYRTNREINHSLPPNSLIVYTPWEEENGEYVRYKREYNIEVTTLLLFSAILDENYNYISDNLKDYKEEKQITNTIDQTADNSYFFEANLHMFDKNDVLKYDETALKNIAITIIEIVLGLGIGGAITYFRNFKFLYKIRSINSLYSCKISAIKSMKQELKDTNEKILSLTKIKGGIKTNE